MDDDDPIPDEVWRALPSNPLLYALKEAYVRRLIERAKKQADFIAANPDIFRRSSDGD